MKNYIRLTVLSTMIFITAIVFTACKTPPSNSGDAGIIAEAAPAQSTASTTGENLQNTITVNSIETITVVPDIAEVIYAVQTEAKDAAACQKNNSEEVNKVIELLKSLGITENSIQTSDYWMSPIYSYSGSTQRITGYQSTASLTVTNINIANLANILEQSVEDGINNIRSITYQSSKYDEGYTEALKLAVATARRKAEVLAEAGGCSIGSVVSICENSNYSEARYTDNRLNSKMRSMPEKEALMYDESVSLMPGEVEVEVNITVEYSIY